LDACVKTHTANKYFFVPKFSKDKFGIKHTARDGEYFCPGFRDKNIDELPPQLIEELSKSERVFKRIFFNRLSDDEQVVETVRDKKEKFLAFKFKREMQ
jgi:myosin heavy subunit